MKVTITLGKEAMEFVTGIPEEELPDILSDVVERSLREQVRPLSPANSNAVNDSTAELLNQLRELILLANITKNTNDQDNKQSTTDSSSKIKEAIVEVATSIKLETGNLDMGEFGDLFK